MKNPNSKKMIWIAVISICGAGLFGAVMVVGLFFYHSHDLPDLDAIENYDPRLVTQVYDANDKLIVEYSTEKRFPVPFERISQNVVDAFIAAEDDQFFTHRGINIQTIVRAAIQNFRAGRTVQGGSTITQQVAKSILLSPEKSYTRKIKEVMLAFKIEKALNKNQILNLYLNHIFLGSGAYGIEAAAQVYFGKTAFDLTLPEAAILAGLPKAPSNDNPHANPAQAKNRQRYVLRRLHEVGVINREVLEQYLNEPLRIRRRGATDAGPAPFFSEHVRRYLVEKYGKEGAYEQGLQVYTTLRLDWQVKAQQAVDRGLEAVDKRIGYRRPDKVLKTPKEIQEFTATQHREILARHFNYQLLQGDGTMAEPVAPDAPTPIQPNQLYSALVVGNDLKSKNILIQVGNRQGLIDETGYSWTQNANPTEVYKQKIIRRPLAELERGAVIQVRLVKEDAARSQFSLEQQPLVQGALLAFDIENGGIVSMVGGYNYNIVPSQFNRAVQAKRQSGSAFKPFVFLAGLEAGLSPATILVDSPIVFRDPGEESALSTWKPDNYSNRFYGDTSLRDSLAFSRNIPTIKLLQHVGVAKTIELIRRLGIQSPLNQDLSLGLGSSSLTLEELLTGWGPIANLGREFTPHYARKIISKTSETFEEFQARPRSERAQILSSENAYVMTSLLKSVVDYGTAANALNGFRWENAGKTGTTNDYQDALYLGYTPQILTGVWVGFDDNTQIGPAETGGRAAIPIWREFMTAVQESLPEQNFIMPSTVIRMTVDTETGDAPGPNAKKTRMEVFAPGTAPGQPFTDPVTNEQKIARAIIITGGSPSGQSSEINRDSNSPNEGNSIDSDDLFRQDF